MESNPTATVEVKIVNKKGLHARAASQFVQLSSQFECDVFVSKEKLEINGKSIMGVLMLIAEMGSTIEIRCQGEGCTEACDALAALVKSGFGESTGSE